MEKSDLRIIARPRRLETRTERAFPHSHSDGGNGGPQNRAGEEKPKPDRSLAMKTGQVDKLRTCRNFTATLETHPESLPGNCALQFRLAERQN